MKVSLNILLYVFFSMGYRRLPVTSFCLLVLPQVVPIHMKPPLRRVVPFPSFVSRLQEAHDGTLRKLTTSPSARVLLAVTFPSVTA